MKLLVVTETSRQTKDHTVIGILQDESQIDAFLKSWYRNYLDCTEYNSDTPPDHRVIALRDLYAVWVHYEITWEEFELFEG